MKNKKYMFIMSIILIILIILVTVQGCMIWNMKQGENTTNNKENKDSIKYSSTEYSKRFKEEYEALNNTEVEEGGENYNTVNIPEENPIVYVDVQQLVNIINSDEEAYIYMSSPTCPYCRATIGTLLEVAEDLGVEKLYYFDLDSGMIFESDEQQQELTNQLVEKGFVTLKEDGSESWRIPLVAKTKSGEVLAKTIGTSIAYGENQSKYSELTDEQKQELYNEYYELLKD